jgi:hypothetical protein
VDLRDIIAVSVINDGYEDNLPARHERHEQHFQ